MLADVDYALRQLDWMWAERIWPNDLRYLWSDDVARSRPSDRMWVEPPGYQVMACTSHFPGEFRKRRPSLAAEVMGGRRHMAAEAFTLG